ncbi:MAG: endonuclease III [Planctomycetes bacterium]|nr:endonuclease III [Planctomycetota bacterium]
MEKTVLKDQENKKVEKIVRQLYKEFPGATTALGHKNALDLLVATILSAQCTDQRVNIVTKDLFKKYKTAKDYANASIEGLQNDIKSINFFRNKASNINKMSKMLIDNYQGSVPDTMDKLVTLPGVARKTANIILSMWYKKADGVVVDTHVSRVTQRLGLTKETKPEKIERDLMSILPKKDWISFSNMIILHGRKTCKARNPDCNRCSLSKLCPSANKV